MKRTKTKVIKKKDFKKYKIQFIEGLFLNKRIDLYIFLFFNLDLEATQVRVDCSVVSGSNSQLYCPRGIC